MLLWNKRNLPSRHRCLLGIYIGCFHELLELVSCSLCESPFDKICFCLKNLKILERYSNFFKAFLAFYSLLPVSFSYYFHKCYWGSFFGSETTWLEYRYFCCSLWSSWLILHATFKEINKVCKNPQKKHVQIW